MSNPTTLNPIQTKFKDFGTSLAKVTVSRAVEIELIRLALVSQLHCLFLGDPGIAKSYIVDQAMKRIGLPSKESYFKILLSPFTADHEVMGGPDLPALKSGDPRRIIDGMFPTALYAMLDEVYKGSSAINNMLLMAMNERQYRHGKTLIDIPIRVIFAASNEGPGPDLAAHHDRFTFRCVTRALSESSQMMDLLQLDVPENPEPILTVDDIDQAVKEASTVEIPDSVLKSLVSLRKQMDKKGFHFSDRRLRQSLQVIRASAWLAGRDRANGSDLLPLQHVLWTDPSEINEVGNLVVKVADPLEAKATDLLRSLETAWTEFKTNVQSNDASQRGNALAAMGRKLKAAKDSIEGLEKQVADENRTSPTVDRLRDLVRSYRDEWTAVFQQAKETK